MKNFPTTLGVTTALTGLCAVLALKSGVVDASWSEVWRVFVPNDESFTVFILRHVRLPRILLALLAGAALGVSGVILQKVLHNDLAAPEIIGISSGAGCAGMLLIFFLPEYTAMLGAAAFAGALLAAALVYLAAWKRGLDPARLVLAGVAVSTLFSAFTATLMMLNAGKLIGVFEFSLGGVAGKSFTEVGHSLPFFAVSFLGAGLMARRLEILSLDDSSAASLGIRVESARLTALALAALAAASAVSVAGLLGFVGLMAPHIARALGAVSAGKQLPLAAVTGALLTVLGEWLGRIAAAPHELPAGVFLSAAGAAFFLFLLLRNRREEG
ncbi:MAG: iron ABC transporter permease [Lentisphaeria bacterium]|nr:iron ABC transporter permease [Lentisphaeria bacterium]